MTVAVTMNEKAIITRKDIASMRISAVTNKQLARCAGS